MKTFDKISSFLPQGEKYLSAENSELMLYKDCDKSDFMNVTNALLKEGAESVYENTVDGNEFSFFCFECENVSCSFSKNEREIRVIAETGYLFPDFNKTEAKGECVPTLFQFETNHSLIDCGMCYILKNRDGSFVLIDSGHQYSLNDSERIHAFLRERTAENEKIRIAGWLFTHGHDDHIVQFTEYLKRFSDDTVIDGLYYNFVSCHHRDSGFWDPELERYCNEFYDEIALHPEISVYRVHTGMEFYIGSFKVTALCLMRTFFRKALKIITILRLSPCSLPRVTELCSPATPLSKKAKFLKNVTAPRLNATLFSALITAMSAQAPTFTAPWARALRLFRIQKSNMMKNLQESKPTGLWSQ